MSNLRFCPLSRKAKTRKKETKTLMRFNECAQPKERIEI